MVQRRGLLAGAAVVGAAAALPGGAAAASAGTVEDVIFGRFVAEPVGARQLSAQLAVAGADFRATRYGALSRRLPRLLGQALASRSAAGLDEQAAASERLAAAYALATRLLLKLHDNGLAFATADRAVQAARSGNDPVVLAESRRLTATVLRRGEHSGSAQSHVLEAAEELRDTTGLREDRQRAQYGQMLAVAAYTAAIRDDRDASWTLLEEARAAAFDETEVAVYRISVARTLGDFGAAVEHARRVDPTRIASPERRARFYQDAALSLHGHGRPESALRLLYAAERDVPEEVSLRPWAQQLRAEVGRGRR